MCGLASRSARRADDRRGKDGGARDRATDRGGSAQPEATIDHERKRKLDRDRDRDRDRDHDRDRDRDFPHDLDVEHERGL
jgi:hypothetical protein